MYKIFTTICTVCDEMQNVIDGCPAEAIVVGTPYPFITDDCVDCGWCENECPNGAISEVTEKSKGVEL